MWVICLFGFFLCDKRVLNSGEYDVSWDYDCDYKVDDETMTVILTRSMYVLSSVHHIGNIYHLVY